MGKFNRQMRRRLERQKNVKVVADAEARGRIAALEREIEMIKRVMRQQWPQYFQPPQTKGGVMLPSGADVASLEKKT